MKRKREGSSLIVIIIIFMFISIVSIAILSMASGNYKARVIESKRVENLYKSESGLDVAYNIIGKDFDAASKYGFYLVKELISLNSDGTVKGNPKSSNDEDYKALKDDIKLLEGRITVLKDEIRNLNANKPQNYKTGISERNKEITQRQLAINEDNEMIELLLNEEFKRGFKNFIKSQDGQNHKGEEGKEYTPNKLKENIEEGKYVLEVTGIGVPVERTIIYSNTEIKPLLSTEIVESTLNNEIKKANQGTHYNANLEITLSNKQNYNITVTSNFETTANNTNDIGTNKRTVQAKYTLKIPNYDDVFLKKGLGDQEYLALKDRALTIGGDMIADDADNFNVNGDIFVQGNEAGIGEQDLRKTYEKYRGGITLNNNSLKESVFNGDVITRNTFNIGDNVNININGNLYAGNVYLGKIGAGSNGFANNSFLNINQVNGNKGQVIIDNDLTVKANGSEINMQDFYGINSNTINKDYTGNRVKSSSSMIVNSPNGNSKITINDKAYILGVAYIDTKDKSGDNKGYKTGESTAVKGNYKAYSIPGENNDEKFAYYDPLWLLDKDQSATEVSDKSNHFSNYWNNHKEELKTGGIIFKNPDAIKSIGAVLYNSNTNSKEIKEPIYNIESLSGEIGNQKKDFASKVYKFGEAATIDDYNESIKQDISTLINLDKTVIDQSGYIINDCMTNKNEFAIFNEYDKDIVITTSTGNNDTINISDSTITISVSKKGTENKYILNAVIATNGNVSIKSGIVFNGNIIANKDLNIDGDNVTINYNSDVIGRIQSQNSKLFMDVFGGNIIEKKEENIQPEVMSLDELQNNYNIKNFIQNGLWRLVK